MVDTGTSSYPRLGGTIASRYLDAISCGGTDISALTVASSGGPRWTPERPKTKSSHRKFLNDSSCGMTAPTALETSASWSSKETPSRSEAASSSRRSGTGWHGRAFPVENSFATSPETKLGMEDECSSIESSSSHRRSRPAHLSLHMDHSFGETSFDYESFGQPSSPGVPSPSRIMQKARDHLAERRHRITTPVSHRIHANNVLASQGGGVTFFPKTSPRTPPHASITNDKPRSAPPQGRRTVTLSQSSERSYPGGQRRALNWMQRASPDEATTDSVAGAPTEVTTNRTRDLLKRTTGSFPVPSDPPQVRRWLPPTKSDDAEHLLHSLIDDASTNEESTTNSPDRRHLRALFDTRSSSISASHSTENSKHEAHVQRQQNSRYQNSTQYIQSAKSNSFEHHDDTYPKPGIANTGKAVFGGRAIGTGPRTMRRLNATTRRRQNQVTSATDLDDQVEHLPASPVRFFMKDDSIQQPRTPQPASSGEVTSSVSTTDALLVPDSADRTPAATTFIRYNARKTPNAHEVFQRRYSDSSNTSTLSTSDKEHDDSSLPTRPPIQPLFSLDRLDFSYDAESPIRKRSQSTQYERSTTAQLPTRSMSFTTADLQRDILRKANERRQINQQVDPQSLKYSEAAQRFAIKKVPSHPIKPDPIFCPTGSKSFSPPTVQSSENDTATSRSSHEDYINVRHSAATHGTLLDRNDSTSTGLEDGVLHLMETNNQDSTKDKLHGTNPRQTHRRTVSTGTSEGASAGKCKLPTAMCGSLCSIAPNRKNTLVRQRIQAFNLHPPDKRKQTNDIPKKNSMPPEVTSRDSLVFGAHIAGMVNEEKKEESFYFFENIDDDDTGSVKSLREKFEKRLFGDLKNRDSRPEINDDDDNFSVKSLREKLERYWSKDGNMDEDDGEGDEEGSVRSLREKFEPPKKRESQAMVSNLRSVFEPKKPLPKVATKSRPETKKPVIRPSHKAQTSFPNMAKSRVDASVHRTGYSITESIDDLDDFSFDQASDTDSQAAQIDLFQGYNEPTEHASRRSIDRYIEYTSSDKSGKATGGSADLDEDTISTHSSRVRGPTPTAFLSMKERLLKFSQEQPPPTVASPQKKPAVPSMHQRLNLWANRHQSRKLAQLTSSTNAVSPQNKADDSNTSGENLQTVMTAPAVQTNEVVKERQIAVESVQDHERSQDRARHFGKGGIFRDDKAARATDDSGKTKSPSNLVQGHDMMIKSNGTDVSDGVTLDPSIADVSILTDPTIHRTEEMKDLIHRSSAVSSAAKQSGISPSQASDRGVPIVSGELHFKPKSDEINVEIDVVPPQKADTPVLKNISVINVAQTTLLDKPETSTSHERESAGEPLPDSTLSIPKPSPGNHFRVLQDTRTQNVELSPLADDDWIDFSPSRVKEYHHSPTLTTGNGWDTVNQPSTPQGRKLSNDVNKNNFAIVRQTTIPPQLQSTPQEKPVTGSYSRPPSSVSQNSHPTSSGTGDEESHLTGLDSEATSSLPPLPSPFDKDYEALMEARHKMLLSRQRSHQERKAARDKARALRNELPAEPPGLRMTDFDPLVTPFIGLDLPHGNPTITRSTFFGRTHPTLGASKSNPNPQNRKHGVERTTDNVASRLSKESVPAKENHQNRLVENPSPNVQSSKNQSSHMKVNDVAKQTSISSQPTSILTRLTGSMSRSGGSRQETLVARLKSVKAARIRRKVTPRNMPSHKSLENEDSDENTTTASTTKEHQPIEAATATASTPAAAPIADNHPKVPTSNEAFQHYMATSLPPPPPPPPRGVPASYRVTARHAAVTTSPAAKNIMSSPVDPGGNASSRTHHPLATNPSYETRESAAQRYIALPPPPPPPRYPDTGIRYRPPPPPMAKNPFTLATRDEADKDSSSSSNSSSFFRDGLAVD